MGLLLAWSRNRMWHVSLPSSPARPRRGGLAGLALIIAAAVIAPAQPAAAQIQWKSDGIEPEPWTTPAQAAMTLRALVEPGTVRHLVVQFDEPVTPALRRRLAAAGLDLGASLGDFAWFARAGGDALDVARLAAVRSLRLAQAIERPMKLHPIWNSGDTPDWSIVDPHRVGDDGTLDPVVGAYILFHRDVPLDEGMALATEHGAVIRDVLETINGLVIELPRSAIDPLADADRVQFIDVPLPKLSELNDSNRVASQAGLAQAPPYNLDGSDVRVLVYDGGTAAAGHADFQGRLTTHDSSGVATHATHVSGTIGGAGVVNPTFRGMAPACRLYSYGFEWSGPGTFLYDNPGDIESNYADAINTHLCVVANNSIGSNTESNGFNCDIQGDYGATDQIIDGIVRGSLGGEIRIVWANGNERQGSRCDLEGFGDYYSIAPPATAKNHITIGALNSNDNSMTSFSSWGPTDDGRMKPDVSAPGCQSGGDNGVTSCNTSNNYSVLCGTSMAAPTVTGCVALLLEDFRATFPGLPDPANSTVKVLLAHNALNMLSAGPDYQTGYGLVQIRDTIDFTRTGNFVESEVGHGSEVNFVLTVPPGSPSLKVTIAWDDAPGTLNVEPALVNDLDLVITGPAGTRFPWTLNPASPSSAAVQTAANRLDNIEQVFISNPPAGQYTATVSGFNVPEGPQRFSIAGPTLVVTAISFPGGLPAIVPPATPTPLTVRVFSVNESLVGTPSMFHRTAPGPFTETPLSPIGGNDYTVTLPGIDCDEVLEYYFRAEASISGTVLNPSGAPASTYSPSVGTFSTLFTDNAETNMGWTVQNGVGLVDGAWDRGVPVNCNRGDPPADGDGSGQCWLTDNSSANGCNSDVDDGSTTLLSPILDASMGDLTLAYDRWYSNNFGALPGADVFVVEFSTTGGSSWQNLETVGPTGPGTTGGWVHREFLLSSVPGFTPTSQFRIRFTASDLPGQGSVVEAGVDGIELRSFQCVDVKNPCPADCAPAGGDGIIDIADLLDLLAQWGGPGPCDTNGDDTINIADLLDLLAAWGACP
jgi:hypothetical protein